MEHLKLPTIVLACKSDLEHRVDPMQANSVIEPYDTGLVEVSTTNSSGKDKLRASFDWIFKAIYAAKRQY